MSFGLWFYTLVLVCRIDHPGKPHITPLMLDTLTSDTSTSPFDKEELATILTLLDSIEGAAHIAD